MNARRFSGYWIVVVVITLTAMLAAYFKGAVIDPSPLHRIVLAALIGTLLLLLRPAFTAAWRVVAQHASNRESNRYKRDPAARVDVVDETDVNVISQRFANLRLALKDANGFRWRYRQPWLLLTGDDTSIRRLLPDLAQQGWLVTDAAVLLWSKTDKDGRPNEAWLKQLRALRRNRPIDVSVLTLDGAANLSQQHRGTNAYSVTLARIANVLHWS